LGIFTALLTSAILRYVFHLHNCIYMPIERDVPNVPERGTETP